MIIGTRHYLGTLNQHSIPPVVYNDTIIAFSDKAKNLGVMFDSELSWTKQVSEVSRRVFGTFHSLRRLQNFLPHQTKVTLAQSLLLPLIDYADVCWASANEEQLNRLERLQNLGIRFIFGLRKFDHVSKYRKELKWLPIRLRRDTHILTFLYSILTNPRYPSYLRDLFDFLPSNRQRRTFTASLLTTPCHNTVAYQHSFRMRAILLWNSLPSDIRDSTSLPIFKNRLKEHYLSLS